jgi:hypothetical protein
MQSLRDQLYVCNHSEGRLGAFSSTERYVNINCISKQCFAIDAGAAGQLPQCSTIGRRRRATLLQREVLRRGLRWQKGYMSTQLEIGNHLDAHIGVHTELDSLKFSHQFCVKVLV